MQSRNPRLHFIGKSRIGRPEIRPTGTPCVIRIRRSSRQPPPKIARRIELLSDSRHEGWINQPSHNTKRSKKTITGRKIFFMMLNSIRAR